jgi:hypothetical protein
MHLPTPTNLTGNLDRRQASVTNVVRMPSQYCKCPVELFRQHQAGKFMGQRHWSQGQQRLRLTPIRPAIRRPNGENNSLLARIPAQTKPLRQLLGRESLSSGVEQYQPGRRPRPLASYKIEESLLAPEWERFNSGIGKNAIEV